MRPKRLVLSDSARVLRLRLRWVQQFTASRFSSVAAADYAVAGSRVQALSVLERERDNLTARR